MISRSPLRVTPALIALIGVALGLQSALWLLAQPLVDAVVVVTASALLGVSFFASVVLLRRAFAPLSPQAAHLQALARVHEPELVPKSPSPPSRTADPATDDMAELKRRLRAQLEDSERLRQQAEQASAYKTGFLRSVRHELRTPLNAILGFSEVLLADLEGPLTGSQRENLVVIQRTARRLQDLFDEIIELATVAAGQLELQHEAVDPGALLEEVCEELEEERGDRPVHIRVDMAGGTPHCTGDPFRLKQLLRGMASHALAVSTGQLLVLSVDPCDAGVRLSVRDPGRKLSQNEVAALLAQRTVASRRKGLDEGSRLRIAIWQQLAQLYGGQFSVDSDDGGTSYALELPVWRQP